jgi:AAA family ATP:ADP antiporter
MQAFLTVLERLVRYRMTIDGELLNNQSKGICYMGSKIKSMFRKLFEIEQDDRLKILFLSLIFFLIISAYTLARDLKDAVFITMIGKAYVPYAKGLTMLVLVPAILFYSSLVDRIRRYQLLCCYSAFFGIGGLIFAYFMGHPVIGLANTHASADRLFGWLFYFFVEGYSPFVVSVFWAFANSVNSPESAKKNYGLMVSASKFGGMLSAGFAWALFSWRACSQDACITDVGLYQLVLTISSLFLIGVPYIVYKLIRTVPGEHLHGYEAAYNLEKQKKKEKAKVGIFDGLKMLLEYPYVMGIFGMVYFYEVIAAVCGYLRLSVAQSEGAGISAVAAYLFQGYFITHFLGVLISLIGTRTLLQKLGERVCLLLIPLTSGALLFYFMAVNTQTAFLIAFVALKSINYAFSWPVRESLYIPTVKEIKFKSKSWIDAFGSRFAKFNGSLFNLMSVGLSPAYYLPAHSFFFASVIGLWFTTAFFLGKRFDDVIAKNKVIGSDED